MINQSQNAVLLLMKRIVLASISALILLLIIGSIIGNAHAGYAGLIGAILAFVVLLFFSLTTPITFAILGNKHLTPRSFIGITMGSWVVKILIIFIALLILKHYTWFNHVIFAWILAIGALLILFIESILVLTSNIPLINTPEKFAHMQMTEPRKTKHAHDDSDLAPYLAIKPEDKLNNINKKH